MTSPRRFLGPGIGLLVLLLVAGGAYVRVRAHASTGGADSTATSAGSTSVASVAREFGTDVAIPVAGDTVIRGTLVLSVTAAGQATAVKQTKLLALVEGRLDSVLVHDDAPVAAGALMAAIDPAQYALAEQQAEAQLRQAQAQYNEYTLFDESIQDSAVRADRARAARAKSGLETAELNLKKAQLDLKRARVMAPFAGRVASVKVVPGQWVRAGDELMTVVDLDPIQVEVQVLESEVGYLTPGRTATVSFAAFPDERFVGRIASINPLVESTTRTAKVLVTIPNPHGRILPGMYARVSLDARRFPNRVLVPRSAILERDRRTMLFVYDGDDRGGLAKWRYVTTGIMNDSLVEILPDPNPDRTVKPGEVVLTDGQSTLIHNAHVRLVKDVAAAGGRPE
jgi:RND family efflux transporter MFP subunit